MSTEAQHGISHPPSREPVVDGPLDPHGLLPGPGHLHEVLPNKVIQKGSWCRQEVAGRRLAGASGNGELL